MRECKLIKFTCLTKRRTRLSFPVSVSTLIDKPFSTWHKTLEQNIELLLSDQIFVLMFKKASAFQ